MANPNNPNDKENIPSSRTTPLLHHVPFAPSSTTTTKASKKNITPAYAYKNRDTGLLEISNRPPPLSLVADEDDSVIGLDSETRSPKLALYPIALNGGGTGLYQDPREFGGRNINTNSDAYFNGRGNVRFAWPAERRNETTAVPAIHAVQLSQEEEGLETIDLEAQTSTDVHQQPLTIRRTSSRLSTLSNLDPWKLWSNIHTELSRLAAIRTTRLEDESSHVTLAKQKNLASTTNIIAGVYNQNDFDFALVLSPNEAYAFWAQYLDFRDEALCGFNEDEEDGSTIASMEENVWNTNNSSVDELYTPTNNNSGLRRRKGRNAASVNSESTPQQTPFSKSPIPRPSAMKSSQKRTLHHQKSLFERAVDKFSPRFSLGGSPKPNLAHSASKTPSRDGGGTPDNHRKDVYSTGGKMRRRWGNQDYESNLLSTPNLTSPPIVSLKSRRLLGNSAAKRKTTWKAGSGNKRTSSLRKNRSLFVESAEKTGKRGRETTMLDNGVVGGTLDETEEDNFFASPGIPRGVAARVNGLDQFLEALDIGIVVRRHWPRGKSVFIQLYSDDKGDTINYRYIPDDEAVIALREQEQRYNGRRRKKKARLSFGVNEHRRDSGDNAVLNRKLDASVPLPDYLKAKIDRDENNRKKGGLKNTIRHSTLSWLNTGEIEAKDIVQVHPATHVDPFARDGNKLGTWSLRQSEAKYVKNNAFSIILPSTRGAFVQKHFPSMDLGEKWCDGEHQSLFRSLDIELATEGEYWMVLRGFLLLYRDASAGRFSAQRAGGFGSYHRHALDVDKKEDHPPPAMVRFAEVLPEKSPPSLLTRLTDRIIHGKDAGTDQKIVPYTGVPPPSDYFLGFSSPGTQIWGRLRQAGLETQRLYALDTKKVMIKVRCPVDRLQDVAEALKLKLKTKDGDYAPYREDLITHFVPTGDGQVVCDEDDARVASLFRSSDRQKIIDFVIGSRIRDSGAELGPSSQLGKQIKARVPLHSHDRLEALYNCWVTFWNQENWNLRDGKSLRVEPESPRSIKSEGDQQGQDKSTSILSSQTHHQLPTLFYRFFIGSFYQPLDSIEEYYGEKIAFYFAWLQHVSFHLLYLSVIGLIVFWIQLSSGVWDNGIRPYFSILVVIWSFTVVVTWRRRSNFLAYKWGTLDYKEEEIPRPEFKGTEYRVSPITQTYELYYPPWKRWLMMCISIPLTIGFTLLTLFGILIFYGNRDVMLANYFSSDEFDFKFSMSAIGQTAPILAVELTPEHLSDPDFWLIIIGFPTLLGITLPLLNFVLRRVSIWLNDIENHRTEAEYRTHFIIKVFAFRFVCYFAALYYYSFIGVTEKDKDPQATEHGILRVASTLFTYLTIAHWWNICINVFFPLLLYRWRIYRERRRLKKQLRSLELEEIEEFCSSKHNGLSAEERLERKKQLLNQRILLEHAQVDLWEEMLLPEHDSFTEYLFAVTQFAYVCCFSVVLPITPVIVLINHLINMRLDAFKLCRGRRRPLAVQTGGIGVWNHVLHIVTVIAILTNCALMALTTSQLEWLGERIGMLGVFALSIGVEHFLLLVKYIMQLSVSRLPSSVENEMKKKKYDQERKRYRSLRMKKRSKSSYGTKNLGNDEDPDNSGETVKMSPIPPIQESSTDISEARLPLTAPEQKKPEIATAPTSSNRVGLVNVRSLVQHSPSQTESQLAKPRASDNGKVRRNKYTKRSPSENSNPNFVGVLQSNKKKSDNTNQMPPSTLYLDACSSIETNSSKPWHLTEKAFSPDSSISTLPTPCHLRLESPNSEYEDNVPVRNSDCYQYASAPPMSPDVGVECIDLTNDNDDAPAAKWAVYHSFQYNKSAQKELRGKKSR